MTYVGLYAPPPSPPAPPPPGSLADLTTTAGVHIDGATGNQGSTFQSLVQTTAQGGPYNFKGYLAETGFSSPSTSAQMFSIIGNATDGYFVETGNNAGLLAIQFWALRPTYVIYTLPLSWGSFNMSDANRKTILDAVAVGDANMDAAFAQTATRIHASGLDAITIVRPGWESNQLGQSGVGFGNFPWVSCGIEQSFINAYRHCVSVMRANGYTGMFEYNVVGDFNAVGSLVGAAYPGDDVVDVVGMDFYHATTGQGVDTGVAKLETFAAAHNKQVGFSEWGYFNTSADDPAFMTAWMQTLAGLPAKGRAGGLAYQNFFDSSAGSALALTSVPNSAAILKQWIATGHG